MNPPAPTCVETTLTVKLCLYLSWPGSIAVTSMIAVPAPAGATVNVAPAIPTPATRESEDAAS